MTGPRSRWCLAVECKQVLDVARTRLTILTRASRHPCTAGIALEGWGMRRNSNKYKARMTPQYGRISILLGPDLLRVHMHMHLQTPPKSAAEFGRFCRFVLPICWVSEFRRFVLPICWVSEFCRFLLPICEGL